MATSGAGFFGLTPTSTTELKPDQKEQKSPPKLMTSLDRIALMAVHSNNSEALEAALKGMDVSESNGIDAVYHHHPENGLSEEYKQYEGLTLLDVAARKGNSKAVEVLCHENPKATGQTFVSAYLSRDTATVKTLTFKFQDLFKDTVATRTMELVQAALVVEDDDLVAKLIVSACATGQFAALKELVSKKQNAFQTVEKTRALLYFAYASTNLDVVKFLESQGIVFTLPQRTIPNFLERVATKPELLAHFKDSTACTLYLKTLKPHDAFEVLIGSIAEKSKAPRVKELLQEIYEYLPKVNPAFRKPMGSMDKAALWAVHANNIEGLKDLLKAMLATMNAIQGNENAEPLAPQAMAEFCQRITNGINAVFVNKNTGSLDLLLTDYHHCTLLDAAALNGSIAMVNILLEQKSQPTCHTILCAYRSGNTEVVKHLTTNFPDVFKDMFITHESELAKQAIIGGNEELVRSILRHMPKFKAEYFPGLFYIACDHGNLGAFKALTEERPDLFKAAVEDIDTYSTMRHVITRATKKDPFKKEPAVAKESKQAEQTESKDELQLIKDFFMEKAKAGFFDIQFIKNFDGGNHPENVSVILQGNLSLFKRLITLFPNILNNRRLLIFLVANDRLDILEYLTQNKVVFDCTKMRVEESRRALHSMVPNEIMLKMPDEHEKEYTLCLWDFVKTSSDPDKMCKLLNNLGYEPPKVETRNFPHM